MISAEGNEHSLNEESKQFIVWVISNQHWPRAYLRAELIERDFDAIGFEEIGSALTGMRMGQIVRPDLVVLDLKGQENYEHEIEELIKFNIPVVALMSSVESSQEVFRRYSWTAVIRRPFTIGDVCDLVEKQLRD